MKNLIFMVTIALIAFVSISFNTKKIQKNIELHLKTQKTDTYNFTQNENKITINGTTFNLISAPCVPQDSDEVKMLTFKGDNSDMDYNLSVTIASYNSAVNNGEYVYSSGETKVNFVVITLVTDDATYINNNGFVTYTKNDNSRTVSCKDLTLIDSFENLPNVIVSFNITCAF